MTKQKVRLDNHLIYLGLALSNPQAESYIKLGAVYADGKQIINSKYYVSPNSKIELKLQTKYVSRAGFKLASVVDVFGVSFKDKTVLDVGSSTGGFTDYALQNGAKSVIAVELGTKQMHPRLYGNSKIELHEQTDIRSVFLGSFKNSNITDSNEVYISKSPDIIVIDVSFISLRDILPHISKYIAGPKTQILAMVKPQFEATSTDKNKGIIKNEAIRRGILKDFELWAKKHFVIINKADSQIFGTKGNQERFYLLKKLA